MRLNGWQTLAFLGFTAILAVIGGRMLAGAATSQHRRVRLAATIGVIGVVAVFVAVVAML